LLEQGRIRTVIYRSFPAADAHRVMEGGDHVGKLVLTWQRCMDMAGLQWVVDAYVLAFAMVLLAGTLFVSNLLSGHVINRCGLGLPVVLGAALNAAR